VSGNAVFVRTLMNEVESKPEGARDSEREVLRRVGEVKVVLMQALRARLKSELQYKAAAGDLAKVVFYFEWGNFDVKSLLSEEKRTTWFGKGYSGAVEDWTARWWRRGTRRGRSRLRRRGGCTRGTTLLRTCTRRLATRSR
jgi:hypothetical protein